MDQPLRNLRPEELRRYHEDGVIHARGLFPEPWIRRMADAVDRVVASPGPCARRRPSESIGSGRICGKSGPPMGSPVSRPCSHNSGTVA